MSRRRSRSNARSRTSIPAVALCAALAFVGCAEADQGAAINTVRIVPESTAFAVRPPVTTVEPPPSVEAGEAVDRGGLPGREHIVQEGDYGLLIADRYGVTLDDLVSYNGWDSIASFPWPGEVILIPPVDPGGGESGDDQVGGAETATATVPENCESSVHTIASGDYPLAVAEDYDIAVEDLLNANLGNPDYAIFAVGGEIVIPC